MTNNEIISALASLINDAGSKAKFTLDAAFEIFYNYRKLRARDATLYYYRKTFNQCKEICSKIGIFYTTDLTKQNYNTFINVMIGKNYSNATINKHCDLLKGILSVLNELDYINYNPLKGIKKLKETLPEIKIVNQDVKKKIFDYLFSLPHTPINLRNACYFLIVNDTGARLNEMLNIKVKNIYLEQNTIYLEYTKTGKPRKVFITDTTVKYIKEFLNYHNNVSEYFFISSKDGTRLNKNYIYEIIDNIQKTLKIPGSISPHKWRHSFATELAESNMNINRMMDVLGHTQYSTTKRYLHLNDEITKNEVLSILGKKQ